MLASGSTDAEDVVQPITPPAILLAQTEQGETIAKAITPQNVVIAGEVVAKGNFSEACERDRGTPFHYLISAPPRRGLVPLWSPT